jgi:glycosyltransferase involved in cell wall biosynthesis
LVIAGDADHEDEYSRTLKKQASDAGVILTGFIKGENLNQIMSNAALFAMPSYHEGLPIALLEAMSYNIDALVSDIPANILPCLCPSDYFKVGDVEDLSVRLADKLSQLQLQRQYDLADYNWDKIAEQTIEVYKSTN